MGFYVQIDATFKVAADSSLSDTRANWSESSSHATTGSYGDKEASGRYSIADAATVALAFGPVTTAHYVLIKSDRQVTVKLNGDSTGFALGTTSASGSFVVIPATSVTSISITNASGAAATLDYELVGV